MGGGLATLFNRLSALLAVMVAVLPLLGYSIFLQASVSSQLDGALRVQATVLEQVLAAQADRGALHGERIRTSFEKIIDPDDNVQVLDNSGALVFQGGRADDWYFVHRSQPLYALGQLVGRLDAGISIKAELWIALFVLVGSLVVAVLIWGPLRKLPLAALAEADRALMKRVHYQRALLDKFPFMVWLKDEQGRFLAVNQPFAQGSGHASPDLLEGKTDLDIWPADLAASYQADDLAVLASGGSTTKEEQVEVNGQRVWFETYKSPVMVDGQSMGTAGFARDITERMRVQLRLVESELLLKTLTHAIPDLIWLKDPQGVYMACNQRFEDFFGAAEKDIVGKTDYDFVSQELADFFRAHDRRAMASDVPLVNAEWVPFASDGHRELLETTKTAIFDSQGCLIGVLGIGHDMTARKRAEDKLTLAASVFANAREGIMITTVAGVIVDVNEAFSRITGYHRDEVLGSTPRLLNSGLQQPEFYAKLWRDLTEQGHWYGEVWNRRKNGELFAVTQTISTVCDAQGQPEHFVSLFADVTAAKAHQHKLEHIAHYDALTSLPNRVLLADRLQQGMAQAQRRGQLLAVAYLDLDGFKTINDHHGHEAGDQLLIALAARMKGTLRDGDTLARIGGDEFVAVLVDLPDVAACVPMLTRLLSAAAQSVQVGEHLLQVSASLGVTFHPQPEVVEAEQLLRQADQAMYQAKLAGKNRYHVFDAEQDRSMRGHHESLDRIRRALADNEFVLHYQPKVNMRTGVVVGAEALIRWQHPAQGLLAPAVFLPVIENHPLAVAVGEWVMHTALAQMEAWHASGLALSVSVNVGARQLQQNDFVERLREILAAHPGINPAHLQLELLETSALEDLEHVSQVIEDCRALGVGFALDDFGTGYSSLTYLKRLHVDLLKIDQSFVRDMLDDADDLSILEGVIGLAHAFRRQVIAEGVETLPHGVMLLQLGCELAQGYGIARPMPPAALPDWVARWQPDPAWTDI